MPLGNAVTSWHNEVLKCSVSVHLYRADVGRPSRRSAFLKLIDFELRQYEWSVLAVV